MFEAFAEAAYLGLQVEVDHVEGAEGEVRTARWDPLHLCQSEGRWHVVVLVPATNTLQTFPLSEVRRMESTGQPCAVVSVFEVRKYCAESFGLVVQRQNALQTP
jgi:hypothetical protein